MQQNQTLTQKIIEPRIIKIEIRTIDKGTTIRATKTTDKTTTTTDKTTTTTDKTTTDIKITTIITKRETRTIPRNPTRNAKEAILLQNQHLRN